MKGIDSIFLRYLRWLKCVTSSAADRRSVMRALLAWIGLLSVTFAPATAQTQTLLSETTWGGNESDVSEGVAVQRRAEVRNNYARAEGSRSRANYRCFRG